MSHHQSLEVAHQQFDGDDFAGSRLWGKQGTNQTEQGGRSGREIVEIDGGAREIRGTHSIVEQMRVQAHCPHEVAQFVAKGKDEFVFGSRPRRLPGRIGRAITGQRQLLAPPRPFDALYTTRSP